MNHLFDDYEYCDMSWCIAKKMKEKGLKYVSTNGALLEEKKLQVEEIFVFFSIDDWLKQNLHSGNTQKTSLLIICFYILLLRISIILSLAVAFPILHYVYPDTIKNIVPHGKRVNNGGSMKLKFENYVFKNDKKMKKISETT